MSQIISPRQQDLLFAIIKEFIDTAEAVGSISLQKNLNLELSPATIRSEMADLVTLGYLFQKTLSGGRIPTTRGWRFFVDKLIELNQFEKLDERLLNDLEEMNKYRSDLSKLIRELIEVMAQHTSMTAVAMIQEDIYYAGLANLVSIPEFRDQNNLKNILNLLEDYYTLSEVMNKGVADNDVNVLIGEETGEASFMNYAIVFCELRLKGQQRGYIALIGPTRMPYQLVLPVLKLSSESIKKFINL